MSETPRTDRQDVVMPSYECMIALSRQLERELVAMTAERDKDYQGMRDMQAKFIAASQEIITLKADLAAANATIDRERQAAISMAVACILSESDVSGLSSVQAVKQVCSDLAAANARVAAMEQECQRLREALEKYGQHADSCSYSLDVWTYKCDCGLFAATGDVRAAIEAAGREK